MSDEVTQPEGLSFNLPPRLKLAIADMVTVYSRLEHCIIETRWLDIKYMQGSAGERLAAKRAIAREYAVDQYKAIRAIVTSIPGAETDAIWPAMKGLAQFRDLCAHGAWMVDSTFRPLVLWHSRMLESDDYQSAEYVPYHRFDHELEKGRHLLGTFSEFKRLMEKALDEEWASRQLRSDAESGKQVRT